MSRVSERGQITIDKAIREELGIHAGDEAVQRIEDGRIIVEVAPGRHRRSLFGVAAADAHPSSDESPEATRDAAWDAPDPDRRDPERREPDRDP